MVESTGVLNHVNLHYVNTFEAAQQFMTWLGERRNVMGVDTETGGFIPELNRLRLVQFGDLSDGWAIPWEGWGGLAMDALKRYEEPLVLHNSKFDARFISLHGKYKWPWHRTHDTMCMAHLENPLRFKGLKPLSAMLVDPQAAAAQKALDNGMKKNGWDWDTVPVDYPYYWAYAAMDPVLTCHIYEKLAPTVLTRYHEVYDLEMAVTRVVAKMEAKGARVDLSYCTQKQQELLEWAQSARQWLGDAFGIRRMTDMELLKWFQDNGIPMLHKLTASGARQALDKEVLQSIDHDVARTVLNIRKAEKNVGPYFSNFVELVDLNDRVHPSIWTMGTRTARMSITQPALQTLPRKDPTVRTAFIPSEDGVLITCDYDQIEARLAAHFSKDEGLIAAFDGPDDFFCTIASGIFGEPISKKDERRQLTKNTVYGKLYGAGAPKMAVTAGVPLSVMEPVVTGFDRTYPGIRRLQNEIGNVARQRVASEGVAYIETPLGRRLIADDGKDYTLTNYLIQCHAAEILKRKMVELDIAFGDDDFMTLPVHDELVFDVPRDIGSDVQRTIEETMRNTEDYLVPITASSDLLESNWGDKYR